MKKGTLLLFVLFTQIFLAQKNRLANYVEYNFKSETKSTMLMEEVKDTKIINKYSDGIKQCKIVKIDKSKLAHLLNNKEQSLLLSIPFPDNTWHDLKLVSNGFNNHFFDINTSSKNTTEMPQALCYRGIVDNRKNSLAAISFFNNDIIGVLSTSEEGNINIGKIKEEENLYVIYFDKDILNKHDFSCGVQEADISSNPTFSHNKISPPTIASAKCIRLYLETDYAMYTAQGSSSPNVTAWVVGMFNVWAAVYQNEGIKIEISEIFIWTTPDAYTTTNSTDPLDEFTTLRGGGFNGDYAHLLALGGNNVGGLAWLGPTCGSNNRTAYSNIDIAYSNLPNYSFTILIASHEFGHNLGSNHTHWCGWPGGAIDNCYAVEGGCSPGPAPSAGTIMSYCHLGVGTDLMLGFGPLPGAVILNEYNTRPCLTSCVCDNVVITHTVTNENCAGANDGSILTTVTGTGTITYFWNTGATAANLSNVGTGTYTLIVSENNACSKTHTVSVASLYLAPTVVAPSSTICLGASQTISASGANSYTWSTSSTAQSILVTPTVTTTYTCVGTDVNGCKNTAVSVITITNAPTATAPSSICIGDSKSISAGPANTYTWSTGSNAPFILVTPTVTTNYTCTSIDAGSCRNVLVAIITVNPKPIISVTSSSVCNGGSTIIMATGTADTYSWSNTSTNANITVSPSVTTNYTCTGSTNQGCKTKAISNVVVAPNPTISLSSGTLCIGNTQNLTATGATSYVWSTGATSSSIAVTPTITATYTCVGAYSTGCNNTAITTVTVYNLPIVSVSDASVCTGKSTNLIANGANNYNWSTGSTSPTITIMPTTNTTYTCIGTSVKGCTNTAIANVVVYPTPTLALTSGTICYGMTATVSAAPALTYTWSNGSNGSAFFVVPNATTVYTCSGSSTQNCPFVSTTTLVVISVITPSISQNGMTLTSSSATGNQWYLNGIAIPGATGQSYTATQNGSYSLIITGNNGCTSGTANKTILDTGLENFNLHDAFSLYPNPTQNYLYISKVFELNEFINYRIYSCNGQLVKQGALKENIEAIDVINFSSGLYLIELSIESHKTSFRFIKE